MSKHERSQRMVEKLRVLDTVSSPGVTGMVLAKGRVMNASEDNYAGAMLLTTVQGQRLTPFRLAPWYFEDDAAFPRWQSGSGANYARLSDAVEAFQGQTGVNA